MSHGTPHWLVDDPVDERHLASRDLVTTLGRLHGIDVASAGLAELGRPQGYLPRDLYNLNSKFGSEDELRQLINVIHEHKMLAIADIVVNHRCAHFQSEDGKWNRFGGRLAWDKSVICSNNPQFGGGGSRTNENRPCWV